MKKKIFEGSAVAIVTPFDENQKINFKSFEKLLDFQLENKTDAIVVCGTTGETPTLSEEEYCNAIKFVVEEVNSKVPVIAGAGSNSTYHAVELSKKAESLGADAILSVTPYYNKSSQEGLVSHFSKIADSVEIPIILYNVPSRTGCNILPQTYKVLSAHENILATKEASSDISALVETMSLCREDLNVYSGEDSLIVPYMSMGALGVISVFANVCPAYCYKLTHAMLEGDYETAKNIQLEYNDLISALFCDVNPIPVKEALNLMGFDCGQCRLPLTALSSEKREKLIKAMKNHSLL